MGKETCTCDIVLHSPVIPNPLHLRIAPEFDKALTCKEVVQILLEYGMDNLPGEYFPKGAQVAFLAFSPPTPPSIPLPGLKFEHCWKRGDVIHLHVCEKDAAMSLEAKVFAGGRGGSVGGRKESLSGERESEGVGEDGDGSERGVEGVVHHPLPWEGVPVAPSSTSVTPPTDVLPWARKRERSEMTHSSTPTPTPSKPAETSSSSSSIPEVSKEEMVEAELRWAISQLELGLKREDCDREQAREARRVLKVLRNPEARLIKKRFTLKNTFGDVKAAMRKYPVEKDILNAVELPTKLYAEHSASSPSASTPPPTSVHPPKGAGRRKRGKRGGKK